ncbi:MAG: prephenate dehydratase [Candidatus Altiarchaeota archaeon]|nr:prephenate dehydratase [Candidatus Altiarchaeota archaeon]
MSERVAVLGPKGTFTESAARNLFKSPALVYCYSVEDVFQLVDSEGIKGVVAIENSLEGSVVKNLELLMEHDVKICGETTLDINLCLMKEKGTREVKTILSHPHALAQCRRHLHERYPNAKVQSSDSTAAAMQELGKLKDAAAVGPKDAAKTYGLEIVAENIQDDFSQTRFIAISKEDCWGKKTSIIFAVKDEPGALYSTLKVFADNNINLTKIESRPSRKKLGEYVFYVDFENNGLDRKGVGAILSKIRERTTLLKNLGSY